MSFLLAVIGSITTATRLVKKIEQVSGISARIVHTPEEIAVGGCSYSVKTKAEHMPIVADTAAKNKIRVKGWYLAQNSDGETVYHDIS